MGRMPIWRVRPAFTDVDVLMIQVTHLTDAGGAVHPHIPDLAGGQTDLSQIAVLGHELGSGTGGPDQLCAPAGFSSTLWMTVPTGMLAMGRQLPGLMSAAAEETAMLSPAFRPLGARM